MTKAEIENAELKLAQLKEKNTFIRQQIADLCVIQEETDSIVEQISLDIINARIALGH